MVFDIQYHELALQDTQKIDASDLQKIKSIIEKKLKLKPAYFGKPLRNTLKNLWSLRIQKYRVIYEIQDQKLIVHVICISKRDQVYELVKKRI
jgi:mRNA interferase RelE/StbE